MADWIADIKLGVKVIYDDGPGSGQTATNKVQPVVPAKLP